MIMNMKLLVRHVRVRVRVDLLALAVRVLVHVRERARRVASQLVGGVRVVVVHLVVLLLFGDDRGRFVVVLLVGVVRELAHGFAACVLPVVLLLLRYARCSLQRHVLEFLPAMRWPETSHRFVRPRLVNIDGLCFVLSPARESLAVRRRAVPVLVSVERAVGQVGDASDASVW